MPPSQANPLRAIPDYAATRQRMEKFAWVLDGAIPVPGTGFRFGLDPLIGLVPVLGDVISLLLGAGIIFEALRIGAPAGLVVRMVGNSAADALVGSLPVVGDVADFVFKSNQRNARLLIEHLDTLSQVSPPKPRRGSTFLAVAFVAAVVVGIGAAFVAVWKLL